MLIIAGIGVNSFSEEVIRKLILAGADILRYNFSYFGTDENLIHIEKARKTIDELNSGTKILIDLPLSKPRLGDFEIRVFAVRENEEFTMKSAAFSPDCNQFIPVQVPKLGEKVKLHQTITIGDGEIAIQVMEVVNSETIKVKVLNNGTIQFMKTFNISDEINEDELSKTYENIIKKTTRFRPGYIALSYINEETNDMIKQLPFLQADKQRVKKIVKIENQTGVENIENICKDSFYSAIMIDRGELGVNMPYEKLGLVEKRIIRAAKRYKKPILVSTQILESTINNFIPYRAEILALTELALSGVNGIMLCQETTLGLRPVYSVHVAKRIIDTVEKHKTKLYDRN